MERLKFEPVPIRRAADQIEERIKGNILNGTLKLGDKLPIEKELAEQFGVSVVTLREALRALETFGLIQKRRGHAGGIFVSQINSESIKVSLGHFLRFKDLSARHLYEVRKIVEPSAIKLAVKKITPDEIEKLEENVCYCEEKLRDISDILDEREFFDLDRKNNDFHRLIAETTHNPILSLTVDYIMEFLPECETKHLVLDVDYCVESIKDHRNIVEGIKERDEEKCAKRMLLHLERLDSYIINRELDLYHERRSTDERSCRELIQNR